MNHPLQCRCGTVRGSVARSSGVNRCVCYCRSKISFVGLVHNCLEGGAATLAESFGPVQAHVNTQSTHGKATSSSLALIAVILRFMALVARARIDGSYKLSPFFMADTGEPIVTPKVLSPGERDTLLRVVNGTGQA
jgi:hypothetical protein